MSHRSFHKPTDLTSRRRRRRSTSSLGRWPQRRLRFEVLENRRLLATFLVTNLDDAGAGSLRQAVIDANNEIGHDTIDLTEVSGTIGLTSGEMVVIGGGLTIEGPGADVLTIDAQQNSRIFNINTGAASDYTIRGVTLTGGRTTGDGVDLNDDTFRGGAIRSLSSGEVTIEDSVLFGNRTEGDYADGGAIFAVGDVTITSSSVHGNSTGGLGSDGGGITTDSGDVVLMNSTLSGNSTEGHNADGGGIYTDSGRVTLTSSTLAGNRTVGYYSRGGGIYTRSGSIGTGIVTLTGSNLTGNSTADDKADGGGIFTHNGAVRLTNSTLSGNSTAGDDAQGGGIRTSSGHVTLTNSTLSGNHTAGYDSGGGGMYSWNGGVTLANSTLSGNNTAGNDSVGGGIFSKYGRVELTNSTVTGNSTAGTNSDGGGIYVYDANGSVSMAIENSIVAGNTVGAGSTGPDLVSVSNDALNVDYSLIGVDPGGIVGVGNITGMQPDLGPLAFNGGPTHTHALLVGSLGIDAGDPAVAFNPAEFDQRGAPFVRVADGGVAGLRIDMGAFERQNLSGTLLVDTTVDESDGDFSVGDLSLREAVELANGTDVDTIEFDPLVFATQQAILLELGEIQIGEAVTIDGPGSALLTVDAQQNSRIFNIVAETGDVTLRGLTLTGGRTTGDNGNDSDNRFSGGAIRFLSTGTLALEQSVLTGNRTEGQRARGGAIYSPSGAVTLMGSTLAGNSTAGDQARGGGISTYSGAVILTSSALSGNSTAGGGSFGGAIYTRSGAVTLTGATLSGNSTTGGTSFGGGIRTHLGDVTVTTSTLSENSTVGFNSGGGGIQTTFGNVAVTDSTISGNSTAGDIAHGGGIHATNGDVTLSSSTVSGNSTLADGADGGGIYLVSGLSTLTIQNSIIAGNSVPAGSTNPDISNFFEGVFDVDYSLIGDTSGLTAPQIFAIALGNGNLTNVDPLLGPLAYNGGPTETHALLAGSPAIDAGDPSIASAPDQFDQRGAPFLRVRQGMQGSGVIIDMGAYERQGMPNPSLIVDTALDESDGDYSAGDLSLREALGLANGDLGANTITFSRSLMGETIYLVLGQLDVTDSVTIEGLRANQLTIDAQQASRVFNIDDGDNTAHQNVMISGLTITGGEIGDDGAGIRSRENLQLIDSVVSGNSATGTGLATGINGGGIYVRMFGGMAVAISGSTIAGNSSAGTGGGIHVLSGAGDSLEITSSTISGNEANLSGGGLRITGSGTTTIAHSTIAFNVADADMTGFGGVGGIFDSSGAVTLDHTIVSSNTDTTGPENDLDGTFTANYSLIGDTSGATINGSNNILNQNARLEPLADNAGPTPTHALMDVSPALDTGNIGILSPPQFDQRGPGFVRIFGVRIDRGAFENQPLPAAFFGDYNQNGVVDAADYVIWRKTLGTTGVPPYSGADGDGDGNITNADYDVWVANFGTTVPPPGAGSGAVGQAVPGESSAIVNQAQRDQFRFLRPKSAMGVEVPVATSSPFVETQNLPDGGINIARSSSSRTSRTRLADSTRLAPLQRSRLDLLLTSSIALKSMEGFANTVLEHSDRPTQDDNSIALDAAFASLADWLL